MSFKIFNFLLRSSSQKIFFVKNLNFNRFDFKKNILFFSTQHALFNQPTTNKKITFEESNIKKKEEILKPVEITNPSIDQFNLSEEIKNKLRKQKILTLFPVQSETFKFIIDGYDVIVQSRTGSGKTLSFALPLIEKLLEKKNEEKNNKNPKMLVLTPTRELANQVARVISSLSNRIQVVAVYGGSSISYQEQQLKSGSDVIVGTPGRIIDLLSRSSLNLGQLDHVVLDEVDRMLDMGFSQDVDQILQFRYKKDDKTKNPQTLLFSATIPSWVRLTANKYLSRELKLVDLVGTETNKTSTTVKHTAFLCSKTDRESAILDLIENRKKVVVFCQTKKEVDFLGGSKGLRGKSLVLHGDISQNQRDFAIKKFSRGEISCLIATDVAARGLDLPNVDLVIQCSIPQDIDQYIHRSGRSGRAGKNGESYIFYLPNEEQELNKIEKNTGVNFERKFFKKSLKNIENDLTNSINNINKRIMMSYEGLSNNLISKFGKENLIKSCLALLAGHEQKSLITLQTGLTTLLVETKEKMERINEAWRLVYFNLPEEKVGVVKNLKLCTGGKSFVFDIAMEIEDEIIKLWKENGNDEISVPHLLPSLLPVYNDHQGRGFNNHFHRNQRFHNNHVNNRYNSNNYMNYKNNKFNNRRYNNNNEYNYKNNYYGNRYNNSYKGLMDD